MGRCRGSDRYSRGVTGPLWSGRLAGGLDPAILDFTASLAVDRRLLPRDLRARAGAGVCPLGAGALAGSSLPLDPDWVAKELGFARRFENSIDAVADRDYLAGLCYAAALCMVHLSRIGEELVLWTSAEYGFAELDDSAA